MTRRDFAVDVSRRLNVPVTEAMKMVDGMLASLHAALAKGDRIEFRNFGVFEVVLRKPKIGRNPQKPGDGQYLIPARRFIRFRMGKDLLEQLNPEA